MSGHQQFESVLATYQDKVFRLCYAMLGDRAAAEETAQEVFVRIWKALPGYRGEAALSTWIYAITRNACLTARKSRAGRRTISLESPGVLAAAERVTSGPRGPGRQPDILRFVGELPPNYRQVVLLYHLEEKSYEEVALMLDLPLGTVKTWLHRARRQLAAALVGEGGMMDEDQALRIVDEELDAALAGVGAPAHFADAVRGRVRARRVSPLPEILDSIGWAAVLAIVAALLLWLAPLAQNPWWLVGLGSAALMPALYCGWRLGGEAAQ